MDMHLLCLNLYWLKGEFDAMSFHGHRIDCRCAHCRGGQPTNLLSLQIALNVVADEIRFASEDSWKAAAN